TFTLGPAGTMQSPAIHTAFRSRTGRSVHASSRCHRPVNGQSGSGGATSSGPIDRWGGASTAGGSGADAGSISGPKQPTIVSVTDTPPDTARNGTEWIWP